MPLLTDPELQWAVIAAPTFPDKLRQKLYSTLAVLQANGIRAERYHVDIDGVPAIIDAPKGELVTIRVGRDPSTNPFSTWDFPVTWAVSDAALDAAHAAEAVADQGEPEPEPEG